jgi:dTDP-4-amino-4,6-dideoxygalactose transaminase
MKIPFSPPFIDKHVIDEVVDTLQSNWITTGPKVKQLELEMTKLTKTQAAVCVNSWSSGASLMLKWFGLKEGDEVILPAYTYCATALSVIHCGAKPVIVDILDDLTIDPEEVKKAITPHTKAIIAVDIAGLPCNYEALRSIIQSPEIKKLFKPETEKQWRLGRILLIADAAHSIGAKVDGLPASLQSDISIFSFHAVKNITTAEGGCVCLNLPSHFNIEEEYRFLKIFSLNGQNKDAFTKNNGGGWRYDVVYAGLKINMPDICAAIGLAQIRQYENFLFELRKIIANRYNDAFKNRSWYVQPVLSDKNRESSYHIFPLRIINVSEQQRDSIIQRIMDKGIVVNVHFIPLPMLSLFKNLGYLMEDCPNAYLQYSCEISLPIYPQLKGEEIDFIINTVIEEVEREFEMEKLANPAYLINNYEKSI